MTMLLTVDGRTENACIAKAPLAINCDTSTTNSFGPISKVSQLELLRAHPFGQLLFGIWDFLWTTCLLFADRSRRFSAASSELCGGCNFSTRRILPRDCSSATRMSRSATYSPSVRGGSPVKSRPVEVLGGWTPSPALPTSFQILLFLDNKRSST